MPANVSVFNLYSEPISNLSVAGYNAGSIAGYSNGSSTPIYTPASLTIPRVKYPVGSAAFAIGDNSLVIPWDSFRGYTTITIPSSAGGVNLDDPLILQLAVNSAMLLTTRGYLLSTFPVQLANAIAAAPETAPDQA